MRTQGRTRHQTLPASGAARQELREKGQFWTPDWVARAMVRYVLDGGSKEVFDPAVGDGALLRAVKVVASEMNRSVRLIGTEIDPLVLERARDSGLNAGDLSAVRIGDFLMETVAEPSMEGERFTAIVANPPYIRHHRVESRVKSLLRAYGRSLIGTTLDGRAGYHVYFLLCALHRLAPGGRLCFIVPSDTVEGVFAPVLWRWITSEYRLDAVITFAPQATPFPGVDTNAVILMIQNQMPGSEFVWARCLVPETTDLFKFVSSGFEQSGVSIEIGWRDIREGLSTGLSRPPRLPHNGAVLSDYARVMRGIATGDNAFFFLTRQRAEELEIPPDFLKPAIGRTRDLIGDQDEVTTQTMKELEQAGRPTVLFAPDGRALWDFPEPVRRYLEYGQAVGVHTRPLLSQRNPWYKMEFREPPPFLFAYLGRRRARFISNHAGVVPLTAFLCVYPRSSAPGDIEFLGGLLSDPRTVANLTLVGKSYGAGAIKVEPRALDRLPLPVPAPRRSVAMPASVEQGVLPFR